MKNKINKEALRELLLELIGEISSLKDNECENSGWNWRDLILGLLEAL